MWQIELLIDACLLWTSLFLYAGHNYRQKKMVVDSIKSEELTKSFDWLFLIRGSGNDTLCWIYVFRHSEIQSLELVFKTYFGCETRYEAFFSLSMPSRHPPFPFSTTCIKSVEHCHSNIDPDSIVAQCSPCSLSLDATNILILRN